MEMKWDYGSVGYGENIIIFLLINQAKEKIQKLPDTFGGRRVNNFFPRVAGKPA